MGVWVGGGVGVSGVGGQLETDDFCCDNLLYGFF